MLFTQCVCTVSMQAIVKCGITEFHYIILINCCIILTNGLFCRDIHNWSNNLTSLVQLTYDRKINFLYHKAKFIAHSLVLHYRLLIPIHSYSLSLRPITPQLLINVSIVSAEPMQDLGPL